MTFKKKTIFATSTDRISSTKSSIQLFLERKTHFLGQIVEYKNIFCNFAARFNKENIKEK